MKVGSQITVGAYDLSGRLAHVWPVTVERVIDGGVVVYSQADARRRRQGRLELAQRTRTYYWLDRGFNLIELYEPGGTYDGIYIHIASPPRIDEGGIAYTDHDLDIVQSAGGYPRWSMWTSFTRPWSGMGFRQSFRPHVSGRWRRRFKCWLGGPVTPATSSGVRVVTL